MSSTEYDVKRWRIKSEGREISKARTFKDAIRQAMRTVQFPGSNFDLDIQVYVSSGGRGFWKDATNREFNRVYEHLEA